MSRPTAYALRVTGGSWRREPLSGDMARLIEVMARIRLAARIASGTKSCGKGVEVDPLATSTRFNFYTGKCVQAARKSALETLKSDSAAKRP